RFGNAITNLLGLRAQSVEVNGTVLPLRRSYADVPQGEAIALVGSTGLIEIAVRDGSGAATLGLERGSVVVSRQTARPGKSSA
ncbi:MAG: SAM-dependent chlorinase/fluorinase, partial [Gemmatimonadota bacterium]|nr:SAM-dependent chlorinase/fluorinase [Gemmatimonadota bacterium]